METREGNMNNNIKDLLLSDNIDDIKLGVELLYREQPELFVYEDKEEYECYWRPRIMRQAIGYDRYNTSKIIGEYAMQNNYYSIKGQNENI